MSSTYLNPSVDQFCHNLIYKLSKFAVMSFCPLMNWIRNFGLREPIKWLGIFPLQYVPGNVMVIKINWYSGEGPDCRIAGQVGRFVPFASFYRYTTAYGTCWLGVIFAQCTVACCSHVFFSGTVLFSGVIDPCHYITVLFCDVMAADFFYLCNSALLVSGSFNTVVCSAVACWPKSFVTQCSPVTS